MTASNIFCVGLLQGHQSLQNARFHSELEDLVTLMEHCFLQRLVANWQLSILEDEALHDVAVVDVDGEDLSQAHKHVVLHAVLGVNERSQLLRKVDCLIDGHLRRILLILLEKEGKRLDNLVPGGPVRVQLGTVLEHGVVLAQLGQEVMKWLDSTGAEDFIKDRDLGQKLTCDLLEATRQLSNVGESDLEVIA